MHNTAPIRITISGIQLSGKTVIAGIIGNALHEAGITNVHHKNIDDTMFKFVTESVAASATEHSLHNRTIIIEETIIDLTPVNMTTEVKNEIKQLDEFKNDKVSSENS